MKVLVIILFFCAPIFAKRRALPDQIISTPVGNFRITDLKCLHGLGTQFVDGKIVNDTTKSWDVLYSLVQASSQRRAGTKE
jgi:hypothetical protein